VAEERALSVTLTAKVKVPGALATPLIWPVAASSSYPSGRPVADQEYGGTPPEAAMFSV
jgi:hypothetical protein